MMVNIFDDKDVGDDNDDNDDDDDDDVGDDDDDDGSRMPEETRITHQDTNGYRHLKPRHAICYAGSSLASSSPSSSSWSA